MLQPDQAWPQIEAAADEVRAEAARTPGVEYPEVAGIDSGLIAAKIGEGYYADAERLARIAMAAHSRDAESPSTAWGYWTFGFALLNDQKFSEAIDAEKKALAMFRKFR